MRRDNQPSIDRLQSKGFAHVVRWTIVLALWTLLISMAIGKFGISNYVALKENAATLADKNVQLALENQILEQELEQLRVSKSAVVQFLAKEVGYVPPGKRIVHFDRLPGHPRRPAESESTADLANKTPAAEDSVQVASSTRL